MASVDTGTANPNDPNNPNNAPGNVSQPGGQTNQPATTGGAGGVTATGSGNVTGQVVGTANPSQPFQNISSYLAANAPQSQALAGQVAGTVAVPITQANTDITNAASDFSKSVNAGFTPENKDLTTAVANNPAYVVGENPENVQNFLTQLNDKYTGPTDFTQAPGYANLQSEIANANATAANTQSEAGINSLLGGVEGPTTAGINKLDTLLLNMNPDNLKTIQAAGVPAANLAPTLQQNTTDLNAAAGAGAISASTAAANALAALGTARGNVGTNLTNEQNTIQGIVDTYNQSVGVINPVVQSITSAIQNFLASNPNIKPLSSSDPLAALENIASIAMPELATYASPEDYAQIAALMQLGDTNVGQLPISSATSGQAQTFNVPTALQNALGQAPGVQSALQTELSGFGNEINTALQPYQDLMSSETRRADVVNQAQAIQQSLPQLTQAVQQAQYMAQNPPRGTNPADAKAALDTAQAALTDAQNKYTALTQSPDYHIGNYWDQISQMAQGLQWVNGTETSYQQLVDAINSQLGKLGTIGSPTLNYSPGAKAEATPGMPIGKTLAQKAPNDVALATTLAGPALPAIGTGLAASAGSAAADAAIAAGQPVAQTTMLPATALGGLSPLASVGPAALAGYGASNIVKNSVANPIESGIGTLANMGLSLATLSLPPQIFNSIGKGLTNIIHDIGSFFGHLF